MKRTFVALSLILFAAPLVAKELYITVRRDFAPAEQPEIELHFGHSNPFTIRVYRPKDMKEFITSQIDLRRAWRKPRVELNSARYLFSGLNKTRLDLDWLRSSADADLRKELMDEFGGSTWSPSATKIAEGPGRLISGPEKFDLITEFTFYPDEQDARAPFDVPGFDWWFSPEGSLRQKTVHLPGLGPGFYLVQVVQGNLEGQVVVVVGDLAAELQQSDGAALVRVARRDGSSAPGAQVEVRNLQGKWIASGSTDADGVLLLRGITDPELLAVIRDKDSTAIVDTEFFSTTAVFPDVYLYTDRPLYRAGSKVRFRGILREPSSGLSRLWTGITGSGKAEAAHVSVVDLAGTTVLREIDVPLSRFGTFDGEFDLSGLSLNGVYRVTARVAGASHIGEFRIKEYVKPLFLLKVKSEQETLEAGAKLVAQVSIERYAGGVPAGVKYGAQLFRIRAESPQWVEDAGMGEAGSATSYWGDRSRAHDAVAVPYLVASLDDIEFDAKGNSTLSLDLPPNLPGPPNYDYQFLLKLFARDPDGNSAAFSKTFLDVRSEVVALVRMSSVYAGPNDPARLFVRAVRPSGKSYGTTKGRVKWTLTPYKAPPIVEEENFSTGENGRWEAEVPTLRPGRLDIHVTLVDRKGRETAADSSILIASKTAGAPLADVSEVTILQERESFAPGETARALVLLPEGWGEKGSNRGRLYVTVGGRSLFSHRVHNIDGLSAWIQQPMLPAFGTAAYALVSYADPKRGWIERTLTFRIPPSDKALQVKVSPQKSAVKPGQGQSLTMKVVDDAGNPVQAELSVAVVDKAVLALQPEFRPPLLSFFYPLERLNVMSFFSREFQSYGYGERLASRFGANWWMASTKHEKKDNKEDDTAYWNARVVTDASGEATVAFKLPANQTIWNVSAVAVDDHGRFGEGVSEFATNAPVTVSLGAPAFLRKGDRARIHLRVSNEQKSSKHVKARVIVPAGLVSEEPIATEGKLDPGKELSAHGMISVAKLDAIGTASLSAEIDLGGETLRAATSLRTLSDSLLTTRHRIVRSGEPFSISAPPGETPQSVRIVATTRFAGSLLPSLRWMMQYPYGCAEQLTSTTVSNLLVRDLFDLGPKAKPSAAKEGPVGQFKKLFFESPSKDSGGMPGAAGILDREEETLRTAADLSDAGLVRLKSLQNPDGSFGWWAGSGERNATMTAIVLSILSSLDRPEPLETLEARRSLGWLRANVSETGSSLGVSISYIESRLHALGLIKELPASAESTLRFQGEWVASRGTVLDKSLMLLALRYDGYEGRPGLDRLTKQLLADVQPALALELDRTQDGEPKGWTPLTQGWPEYPGRISSTLAVAARALHEHGRLDAAQKKKLSRYFLTRFDGRSFGSTFETSQVLVHSAWLLREEMLAAASIPKVQILSQGKPVAVRSSRPVAAGVEIEIDGADAVRAPLVIPGGSGELVVHVLTTSAATLDQATEVSEAGAFQKQYFRLDAISGKLTPLNGPIKVGDLLYVKISFPGHRSRKNWWSSSYYVLSDQIPAGLSVVDDDKAYDGAPFRLALHGSGYSMRDIRPEQIRWFFAFDRTWMDRAFEVGYVLRAHYAGDFASGVARFEDFYDESLFSQTASRRIVVDPSSDSADRKRR